MVLAETAASLHACWDLDLTRSVPVGIKLRAIADRPPTVMSECKCRSSLFQVGRPHG
jgi:hypothetical protein